MPKIYRIYKLIINVSKVLLVASIAMLTIACKNGNTNKKAISDSIIVDAPREKSQAELICEWEAWLQQNDKYNIYLYDAVPAKHAWAINSLCNMFYAGDEEIRSNIDMIQWVLDEFCPIETSDREKQQYEKIEKQVSDLLNFEVDLYQGYEVRRKSAISRLLHEFKIKVYEEKLRSKFKDKEINKLFEAEVEAWNKYMESTSDAYGKIVLRKESYSLKYVFWNNYDFDIMDQRYRSLVCMFLNDYSVWSVDNQCRWDEVGYEYDHLPKKIKQRRSLPIEYDFSYQEKIDALNADAQTFKDFLNAHSALAIKLGINDEGYLLRHKSNTMEKILDYYDRSESLRF